MGPGRTPDGKDRSGVLAWLMAWGVAHALWRGKQVSFTAVWRVSLALILLELVMLFPPVFEAFEPPPGGFPPIGSSER